MHGLSSDLCLSVGEQIFLLIFLGEEMNGSMLSSFGPGQCQVTLSGLQKETSCASIKTNLTTLLLDMVKHMGFEV